MVCLAVVATACQSHDTTALPPAPTGPFVISPSAAFAGSTVLVHSVEFRTRGTGAVLTIGDTIASLVRVDDTTMSVHLPATLGGVVTPVLKVDGYQLPLSSITVFGFAAMHSFEESTHEAIVWPRTGRAVVMGFSDATGGLSFFDLDATTVTAFPQLHHYLHGPGATYQDSIFVFRSSFRAGDDSIQSWRVLPVPERIATYPGVSGYSNWEAMQLGPNQWLTANKYDITTPTASVSTVQPQGVLMSPHHDRALLRALGSSGGAGLGDQIPGIPVFNVPSGQVAYIVPLKVAMDADFSPDGELLAMVGGATYGDVKRVMLFRASTGAVLGDTTLDRNVYSIAVDPSRPLLYVGTITGNRPTIVVLDRATFRAVGEMQAPVYNSATAYPGVIALNSQNGLYFFWYGNGDPSPAWRFTLPLP